MHLQPVKKYWIKASIIYYVLAALAVVAVFYSRYDLALSIAAIFFGFSLIDFITYRVHTRAYQELDRIYFSDPPPVEREQDWNWRRTAARMVIGTDTEYDDPWAMASRHEPRFQRIMELVAPVSGTLIDAGCGAGKLVARLDGDSAKRIFGFDLMNTGGLIRQRSPAVFFVQAAVDSAPFRSGAADVVVCSEVLEHLRNPEKALKECCRLLRRGGMLVATVPSAAILPETVNPFVWMERVLTPFTGIRKGHKPHAVLITEPQMALGLHKLYNHVEFLALLAKTPLQVEGMECVAFTLGPLELPFRLLQKIEKTMGGLASRRFEICLRIYRLLVRAANLVLPQIPVLKNMGSTLLIIARRTS